MALIGRRIQESRDSSLREIVRRCLVRQPPDSVGGWHERRHRLQCPNKKAGGVDIGVENDTRDRVVHLCEAREPVQDVMCHRTGLDGSIPLLVVAIKPVDEAVSLRKQLRTSGLRLNDAHHGTSLQ